MTVDDDLAEVAPPSPADDDEMHSQSLLIESVSTVATDGRYVPRIKPVWLEGGADWKTGSFPRDDSFPAISMWFRRWIAVLKRYDAEYAIHSRFRHTPERLAEECIGDAWRIADHLKDQGGQSFADLPCRPLPVDTRKMSCADAVELLTDLHRQVERAFQAKDLTASTGEADASSTPKPTAETLAPAVRKAWLSFCYAEAKLGRRLEDREAWDYLHENGIGPDGQDLIDYSPPAFDSWSRQLREARRNLGENKNHRRSGRPGGKSVVRKSDI